MKKLLFAFLFNFLVFIVQAQSDHVVISQAFGAGGKSGAPFTHDYIELFNPTNTTVSLSGWSLQYASATGDRWGSGKANLTGSIAPGKYFLIQCGPAGTNGKALPTPDMISAEIIMNATSGKLALVNNATALTGTCPTGNGIVDFVGFGGADCFEKAAAPAASNTAAIVRASNGCTDADNNATDFAAAAPSPRNSASPANFCNGSSVVVESISQLPFCITGSTGSSGKLTFRATGTFINATLTTWLSDASGSFVSPMNIGTSMVNGINPTGSININIPAGLVSGKSYRMRVDASNPSVTGTQSSALEIINGAANICPFPLLPMQTRCNCYGRTRLAALMKL